MAEQHKAIITSEPVRGVCFGEDLNEHISVFVPLNQVVDSRYLHISDLITFELVENPKRPGKFMAVNVRYVGHTIARQAAAVNGSISDTLTDDPAVRR
jgi:hypothetical protein